MRIGFVSCFSKERIEFAVKHGFGSVSLKVGPEVDFFPTRDGWETKAIEVKEAYKSANIEISCLQGFFVNHMDEGKKEEYRKLVRDTILLAEKMGVKVVTGWAGRILNKPLEDSIPLFKKIWSEHAKFANDHGVKIAFENCPMGLFHTPFGGYNMMCTPDIWEKAFNEVNDEALGLQWDPSHLICLFIDPVENLRKFGSRVYAVHAKDAKVNWDIVKKFGIWYPGAIEHCFVGFGDTDWAAVIKELIRSGYYGNLDIEGWHDAVFRDHDKGLKLEDDGLIISLKYLSQFVAYPSGKK